MLRKQNRQQQLMRICRRAWLTQPETTPKWGGNSFLLVILLVLGLISLPGRPAFGQQDLLAPIKFDWPMLTNPVVKNPPIKFDYSPRLVPLWIEALQQSEAGAQRRAAQAIYRASFHEVAGLKNAVPHLQAILANTKGNRSARIAAAHTLIRLDARDSAELFGKVAASGDIELCLLIEPALAAWQYKPVQETWQQRLQDPLTNEGLVLLAIQQLSAVKMLGIAPRLEEIAMNENAGIAYRVEAAKALAAMGQTPLAKSAESLLKYDKAPLVDRLVAGQLLQISDPIEDQSQQQELFALLTKLAQDPQTAVARLALQALLELQPQTLVDQADRWSQSRDPKIRLLVAQALLRTVTPQPDRLRKVVAVLNDAELDVRVKVAEGIKELSQEAAMKAIFVDLLSEELDRGPEFWRSQEQAMILLVDLKHGPAAPRMAALLEAKEAEVFATAAWGLRRLKAVDQLPALQQRADQLIVLLEKTLPEENAVDDVNEQLAQIFQAFGEMKYAEALPTLKRAAQKNGIAFTVRSSAIWAVGVINSGKSDSAFVKFCYERILDEDIFNPEAGIVKQACAIALGQMKSAEAVAFLLERHDKLDFKWACSWSLNQINGHPILEFDPIVIAPGVWFLDVVDAEEGE
ncbi:MAG: hypothetical protein VB862_19245 [Pirellulaceae bacterium]